MNKLSININIITKAMKNFTSNTQKIGELGEDVACKYISKKGFSILERNYTKKWGEIDIIAERNDVLYFIEVKSRSVSSLELSSRMFDDKESDRTRPEDNMHLWKLKRLARTIETYLIHHRIGNKTWQFDLLIVYLDLEQRKARIRKIENIIL
jgi:putative endonuclease